jgi:DNA-binding transcriptional ArsR family regulator
VDTALRALADATRRDILTLVWDHERPAGEIAAHFSLNRPAISQHLTVLLESNLVSVRQEGTRRLYHTNREAVAQLRAELGAFWDQHIGRLKHAAEGAAKATGKRKNR